MIDILKKCILFKNISENEINLIIDQIQPKIKKYQKGEIVVDEGDACDHLTIVIKGKIELSTYFISGDVSSLITLNPANIFGEAILFSEQHTYPISASAVTASTVLEIQKNNILTVMESHPQFLENYLGLLSKKLLFLNDKYKLLSLSTIRGKIAHVLIKLSKEQNSLNVKLPFSKEKMALHICTRRPSLSRELSKMKQEGLIDYEKSIVNILDLDALEEELF